MTDGPQWAVGPVSSAIFRVARVHKALAARLLRDAGLRPGQELVMMTLWEHGPQRQVDLAATLDADAPTMTRSIARLEAAGLVRRAPSATDRRAVIVEATEESRALRPAVERAWTELERATVGTMSARRQAEAQRLLARLEECLTEAYGEAPTAPGRDGSGDQ